MIDRISPLNGPDSPKHSISAGSPGQGQEARRLVGALQLLWFVITFLVLSLFTVDLIARYQRLVEAVDLRALESLGLSLQEYALFFISVDVLVILAHVAISGIIFFRRPFDWMALLVAIALVVNGAIIPLRQTSSPWGLNVAFWDLLQAFVAYAGLVTSIILLTLFPDGRFVPPWSRLFALVWSAVIFVALFFPNSVLSLTTWDALPRFVILLLGSAIGAYAQIYRFSKISTPLERQQTKWALLGLIAAALSPIAFFLYSSMPVDLAASSIPNILFQRVGASYFALVVVIRLVSAAFLGIYFLLFPISFAIAILRYRLWDIDILIRRTLIYSVLTGLLVVIYFVSVLVLQAGFLAFTGQGRSEIVTVFSTLAIAALFVPLRNRVQEEIDKRFYQRKYDASRTLASFSETLRDEVDLDVLCRRLLTVVEEAMQPEYVSLWIKASAVGDGADGSKQDEPVATRE